MNATFVELSPDELAEFVQDPAQLERLFHGQPAGSVGLLWDDAARERLERMSPQLLASATQGLPPDLQEEIAKRLGVVREALGSEDGGKAIVRLMESRGMLRNEAAEHPIPGPRPAGSLDKAWHGVHFLLCGQPEPTPDTLGGVILGGTEVGDDQGYGSARYFDLHRVAEIAAELGRDGLEDELWSRYQPERMNELGIYPGGWDQPEQQSWLLDAFRDLRAFFQEAAANEAAVATCLV